MFVRILFLSTLLSLGISSKAQNLNETFSSTFPPTDWSVFLNNTAFIPFFTNWTSVTVNFPPSPTDYGAFASGQGPGSVTVSEKYLVTPLLRPVAGNNTLTFKIKRAGTPVPLYAKYYVKVSTASNNTATDFDTVATYKEGFTSDITTTFQTKTVDLSAYNNRNIYVAFVWAGNGDNGCYIDDVQGIALANGLPLQLLDFTATPRTNKILLQWTVAGEAEVTHFEIVRSADGKEWTNIGSVERKGTQYSFVDISPVKGRNYYKLIQKEKDGKLTYSPIRTAIIGNNQTTKATLYPNPVTDHFTLDLGVIPSDVTYFVSDKAGKKLLTGKIISRQQSINTDKLPHGSFVLSLSTGENIPFVK